MRKFINSALGWSLGDNAWYLCVEIFWASFYGSTQSFNGAYAIRLGASNTEISLLSSVPALMAVLITLPAGRFLQSRKRRKNWILASLFISRAGTLLFLLVPMLHLGSVSPGTLFVALLCVWTIPAHFFNLGFIPFLSQAVPEHSRADTFTVRNVISGALLAVCNTVFGLWLARVAFPINYQAMFLIGFLFSCLSTYYLSRVNVSEVPRLKVKGPTAPFWRSLSRQWSAFVAAQSKVRGFNQFIINTFLHGLGIWCAAPLYLLFFLRDLHATEAWLGAYAAIGGLANIFGYMLWNRVIHRWGEPKTLKRTIMLMGLYPVAVGLVPFLPAILVLAGVNGLIGPGIGLSHFNTFLKLIPEEEQHQYTALYITLTNIGAFVGPLIGVAAANRFGFAPVLIVCGLLSVIGSSSFWWWPVTQDRKPGPALLPGPVERS